MNLKPLNRMKLGATRHTTAPGSYALFPSYIMSRNTSSPVVARLSALVVGTEMIHSFTAKEFLIEERKTAFPSANRE